MAVEGQDGQQYVVLEVIELQVSFILSSAFFYSIILSFFILIV